MLRTLLAISFVAAACLAPGVSAEIYRWVDSEGYPQYSDRPQPGAETVGPSAKPVATKASTPAANPAAGADAPLLGPYKAFEIASPEANQTLRQAQGKLAISLIVDPPLMPAHRLELAVDGATVPVQNAGPQLALEGVLYGSHRIQAIVRNDKNAVLARTAPITFHLRKPLPPGALPGVLQ